MNMPTPEFIPLIMCIPLSQFKKPLIDQVECEKEKCPDCDEEIWVSARKRKLRAKTGWPCICFICFIRKINEMGIDPWDIDPVDMLKAN